MNAIGQALRQRKPLPLMAAQDMDALHVLPLSILPIRNEGIAKHKLIKNSHLVGVLEAFSSRESGSGQIPITSLPETFGIKNAYSDPDFNMLLKLAKLPSYDVYSLRRSLRALEIPIENTSALKLSDDMNRALAAYMTKFTKPLLLSIYGDGADSVTRFDDLLGLFRDPDMKKALGKLKMMADKLGVMLDQIPLFIEDYGDIFLSLSYYQYCLDRIKPVIADFHRSIEDMKSSHQVKSKPQVMAEATRIQKLLNGLLNYVNHMFKDFMAKSQDLWSNLSADKFKFVKDVIENTHTTIGGVLCGLTVKMNAWERRFPSPTSGSPGAKEDFLLNEIRPGLAELMEMVREQSGAAA